MYTPLGTTLAGGTAASGTLASTGFGLLAWVVAGFTLLAAGACILRLIPKRER